MRTAPDDSTGFILDSRMHDDPFVLVACISFIQRPPFLSLFLFSVDAFLLLFLLVRDLRHKCTAPIIPQVMQPYSPIKFLFGSIVAWSSESIIAPFNDSSAHYRAGPLPRQFSQQYSRIILPGNCSLGECKFQTMWTKLSINLCCRLSCSSLNKCRLVY